MCTIRICKGWNSADVQPPPVAPHVQQEDLEGETVPQYPEHIARMCYDWEKIYEGRRMQAEGEEKEKLKRLELVKIKQQSWVLLRLCKDIIQENEMGWEVGKMRAIQRRVEREGDEEKNLRFLQIEEKKKRGKEKWIQTKIFEKRGALGESERKEWAKYLLLDEKERDLRLETAEAKENLWRWREKGKFKGKEKMRKKFTIEKGEILERRLDKLNKIIKECEKEREEEKKKREEEKKIERTHDEKKKREKNLRIEKKKRHEEKWGMIRWLTEFLEVEVQEGNCSTKGEGVVEQMEKVSNLQMGEKLLEQERAITSSMDKFRIELWSRDGERKIKWEEHNQVKIGGKEQNREKRDLIGLEQRNRGVLHNQIH